MRPRKNFATPATSASCRRRGISIEECRALCCHTVIASAAKQSRLLPRKDSGLLRCARNDEFVEAIARLTLSRHTPRRRGIQYAAASRFSRLGILDRPVSRAMTAWPQKFTRFEIAPSTTRLEPVVNPDTGLARNTAALAISCGVAMRPVGLRFIASL